MPDGLPPNVAEAVARLRVECEQKRRDGYCDAGYLATAGIFHIDRVLAHLDAQAAEIAALREACECYEAMKSGVAVRIADLERRADRLATLIRWALGESPDGMPDFPCRPEKIQGKPHPLYWWRTELRRMFNAALADAPAGQEDARE